MIQPLQDILGRLKNNPDYLWSIVTSYAHIGLNIIVQIMLVPLYLQYLGKQQFGILMIVLASINYLGMGVSWVASGGQRIMGEMFAHGETDRLQRVYGLNRLIFVVYAFITSSIAFVVVWLLQDLFFADQSGVGRDTTTMLGLVIAYVVVLYDLNVDRLVLISIGNQARANIITVISLIVFAVAAVGALIAGYGLPGVMGANLLGAVVARGASFIMLRAVGLSSYLPTKREQPVVKRMLGRMGLGYAAYGVLLLTLLQADTLVLGILGGAVLVADFVLVWKIADVVMQALWRLPESLTPYLIHMDAQGDGARMHSIYKTARKGMIILGAVTAVAFGLLGHEIVVLWVGVENAPDLPWAYPLAGGAMFWMVVARLPAVYAFSTVNLKPLVQVTGIEVVGKVALLLALFPALGLYAPLVAINIVHIFGVAYLYQKLYIPREIVFMDRPA